MTSEQYQTISESFWKYSDIIVKYESRYLDRSGKPEMTQGYLKGVGVGHNADTLIIAYLGYTNAIHFSRVRFPKK